MVKIYGLPSGGGGAGVAAPTEVVADTTLTANQSVWTQTDGLTVFLPATLAGYHQVSNSSTTDLFVRSDGDSHTIEGLTRRAIAPGATARYFAGVTEWHSTGDTEVRTTTSYPGGTLANGQSANSTANDPISSTDILYWLGTNEGTTAHSNPIDGVRIVQTNSGVYPGYGSPAVLADRIYSTSEARTYCSKTVPSSWFQLDFGAKEVAIDKVGLQQRGQIFGYYHRTVSLQYSSDGSSFTEATSATTATTQGQWWTFDVAGFPFSPSLRMVHTSPSSSGYHYFLASELLLWGRIKDA